MPDEKRVFTSSVFVVDDSGATLLIRHLWHKMWLPPGGGLKANETPIEGAKRELREETGLTDKDVVFPVMTGAPSGTPPGFLGYEEHPGKNGTHLNFCFLARISKRTKIRTSEGSKEYDAYDWFRLDEDCLRGCDMYIASAVPPNVLDLLRYIDGVHRSGDPSDRSYFP